MLRYACGLSAEEAAQVMGRHAGTIRGLTFRAIEALRRQLGGARTDEPLHDPIRPAPIASDAAVRRYLEAIRGRSSPTRSIDDASGARSSTDSSPRSVASSSRAPTAVADGRARAGMPLRELRVGVSVTGVMAASDAAIPGDAPLPAEAQHRGRCGSRCCPTNSTTTSRPMRSLSGSMSSASSWRQATSRARRRSPARSTMPTSRRLPRATTPDLLARRLDRQVVWLARVPQRPSVAGSCLSIAERDGRSSRPDAGRLDIGRFRARSRAGIVVRRIRPPTTVPVAARGSDQGRGAGAPPDDDQSPEATPKPDRTPKPPHAEAGPQPKARPTPATSSTPKPTPKGQGEWEQHIPEARPRIQRRNQ